MAKIMRNAIAVFLCLALAGCAGTAAGPEFKPVAAPSGGGVIYIYALGGFAGYGEAPVFLVDGKDAGKLQNKGFLAVPVRAGAHRVTMRSVIVGLQLPGSDKTVKVGPGGSAYFRIDRRFDSMSYAGGVYTPVYINEMKRVPNGTGRKEIAQTKKSS